MEVVSAMEIQIWQERKKRFKNNNELYVYIIETMLGNGKINKDIAMLFAEKVANSNENFYTLDDIALSLAKDFLLEEDNNKKYPEKYQKFLLNRKFNELIYGLFGLSEPTSNGKFLNNIMNKNLIWQTENNSCDACSQMSGKNISPAESALLIPLHPNCQCKAVYEWEYPKWEAAQPGSMIIKYEPPNDAPKAQISVPQYSTFDLVRESGRIEAIKKLYELSRDSNYNFQFLINQVNNAVSVNYNLSSGTISIETKRIEASKKNNIKNQIMAVLDVADFIFTLYGLASLAVPAVTSAIYILNQLTADEGFKDTKVSIRKGIEDVLDVLFAAKYSGEDIYGNKIPDSYTRERININLSQKAFTQYSIYEYYIESEYFIDKNNIKHLLSIEINGALFYNNYA